MATQQEEKRKQQYYPLLSVPQHEMEGWLIIGFCGSLVVFVNGTREIWSKHLPIRQRWEKEGFLASDGEVYSFPKKLWIDPNSNQPQPDLEDGWKTKFLWGYAQDRLKRAQTPLAVCFQDGDVVEVQDWATEPNLVLLLQNRFPKDERFQGHFRLMLSFLQEEDEDEPEMLDISWLNHEKWEIVQQGKMPLEVIVEYLYEDELVEKDRQQERAQQTLIFHTATKQGKYTLENWTRTPFYELDTIKLANQLRQKYPELQDRQLELMMMLPGEQEPEDISVITQQTQQRILEADTPLEVRLVIDRV